MKKIFAATVIMGTTLLSSFYVLSSDVKISSDIKLSAQHPVCKVFFDAAESIVISAKNDPSLDKEKVIKFEQITANYKNKISNHPAENLDTYCEIGLTSLQKISDQIKQNKNTASVTAQNKKFNETTE